jgi:hypothetical protein
MLLMPNFAIAKVCVPQTSINFASFFFIIYFKISAHARRRYNFLIWLLFVCNPVQLSNCPDGFDS